MLLPPLLLAEASQPVTNHRALSIQIPTSPLLLLPATMTLHWESSTAEKAHMPGSNQWVSETPFTL